MGPPCFLVHINDLKSICDDEKYVDDTSVWEICDKCGENSNIQTVADQAVKWCTKNNMQLNTDKTKEMRIYFGKQPFELLPIITNNNEIDCVSVFKWLGLMFNNRLTWSDHIDYINASIKSLDPIRFIKTQWIH